MTKSSDRLENAAYHLASSLNSIGYWWTIGKDRPQEQKQRGEESLAAALIEFGLALKGAEK